MRKKEASTRRNVIKSAVTTLFVASAFSTTGSARTKDSDFSDVVLEDGELSYDGPKQTIIQQDVEEATGDFDPEALEGYMQTGVEGLNDASAAGYVTFEERNGDAWVLPTSKGRKVFSSDSAGILCGTNGYKTGSTLRGPYYALKLDDGLTRDVTALMATGAAAGTIAAAITVKIGAAPASVVAAIAAALAGLAATLLSDNNEGCGVIIRHYPHLGSIPGVGITFRPQ